MRAISCTAAHVSLPFKEMLRIAVADQHSNCMSLSLNRQSSSSRCLKPDRICNALRSSAGAEGETSGCWSVSGLACVGCCVCGSLLCLLCLLLSVVSWTCCGFETCLPCGWLCCWLLKEASECQDKRTCSKHNLVRFLGRYFKQAGNLVS